MFFHLRDHPHCNPGSALVLMQVLRLYVEYMQSQNRIVLHRNIPHSSIYQ